MSIVSSDAPGVIFSTIVRAEAAAASAAPDKSCDGKPSDMLSGISRSAEIKFPPSWKDAATQEYKLAPFHLSIACTSCWLFKISQYSVLGLLEFVQLFEPPPILCRNGCKRHQVISPIIRF